MPVLIQTISLNLTPLTHNDLLKYGLTLLAGVPEVAEYKGISPTIDVAKELIGEYATAVANFAKGGEAVRMLRDDLRIKVEELIRQWTQYALVQTPDQPLLWATAHFILTKAERTPRPQLVTPAKFSVHEGPTKGSIELRQNPQASTKAYVYEYALTSEGKDEPQWHYCLGNTGTCVVPGLLSGRQYQFRAAAWNGTGALAYSPIETRYVQ